MTFNNIRGVRYGEISLLCGPQGSTMYNTTGLNNQTNPTDTAPPPLWNNVSEQAMAQQYNVPAVWKNGPRGWVVDKIQLPVGPELDFNGLKARWFAYPAYPSPPFLSLPLPSPSLSLPPPPFLLSPPPPLSLPPPPPPDFVFNHPKALASNSYKPNTISRASVITFVAGQPVFTLVDPNGDTYVMQAWAIIQDPTLTYNDLSTLGQSRAANGVEVSSRHSQNDPYDCRPEW